ncbi:MAG: (E)-4-hydroxy-3-methylbut-2-enyl-diphosphate synthase [Ignavibacteria bacterium]|nr:(E)-4-hydroxy-3-methylbut-2-enyl-diphosphate synthase [Ignavibacteria bacterium]
MRNLKKYCSSITKYSRLLTREVSIGDLPLGGSYPIRIQSMTTTDTMNTLATVEQSIRMISAGSEYVRITAPSLNEAQNLLNIKNELKKRGFNNPIIADIHFTPNAAELAARIVEKVRINPGNYVDKKKFQALEYSDSEYSEELERIRERFTPLVKICKEYGTAMRIGTNHGSLSDRIMSRYGDTPLGMVESALEFVRICEENNFHQIVLSMKASNPQIMVQAYRLLINKMFEERMNYPLHLGVTEAGDGEDGRIKSSVGIGTLLEDGIGDTIRVSLTEEPEHEIPVAISLAKRYSVRDKHDPIIAIDDQPNNPFIYERRRTFEISNIGGETVPKVIADFSQSSIVEPSDLNCIGYTYNSTTDKWNISDQSSDFIYLGNNDLSFEIPSNLKLIYNYKKWISIEDRSKGFPFLKFEEYNTKLSLSFVLNFIQLNIHDLFNKEFINLANNPTIVFILTTENIHGMAEQRRVFFELIKKNISNPVIIKRNYLFDEFEYFRIYSSTDLGALLIDGFGDGIWLCKSQYNHLYEERSAINRTSFGILQATRTRISKTEYIACPSCGRTLFDLVEVTNKIRSRTEHLKGVKIAIMGCIVNGPGEMADADYGYVGSGIGKITLYKGKEVVKRSINAENALDELIKIIKNDGNWFEPTDNL